MKKRKFKLRYVYDGGATMEEFYNVPVTGIMIENASRISTLAGSTPQKRTMSAEEACHLAETKGGFSARIEVLGKD